MRHQILEDRLLDGFALGRGLDHQVGPAQVGQPQRGADAGHGSFLGLGVDLVAADLALEVAVDQRKRLVHRLLADVGHQDVVSGKREDMCDAVAHLPRSDDPNRLNRHDCLAVCWAGR